MPRTDAEVRAAARRVLAYLAATDPTPPEPVDVIIGFGVFDLSLPRFCGELYLRGLAPRLLFTGGIGAGTGDLGGPEAEVWRTELRRSHPRVPDDVIILETRSTNTAENITFAAALLARDHPALAFGTGLRSAVLVASPSRLRRVRLTMQRHLPAVAAHRLIPALDFDAQARLYARQGVDFLAHLAGELDRIRDYPARGWIVPEPLPPEIAADHALLAAHLATGQ